MSTFPQPSIAFRPPIDLRAFRYFGRAHRVLRPASRKQGSVMRVTTGTSGAFSALADPSVSLTSVKPTFDKTGERLSGTSKGSSSKIGAARSPATRVPIPRRCQAIRPRWCWRRGSPSRLTASNMSARPSRVIDLRTPLTPRLRRIAAFRRSIGGLCAPPQVCDRLGGSGAQEQQADICSPPQRSNCPVDRSSGRVQRAAADPHAAGYKAAPSPAAADFGGGGSARSLLRL